ncbi:MAG: phage portal protein [Sedimentisphaerales bacterium]|nr:phage portal protein [Sedimentisphaerales bacterium]
MFSVLKNKIHKKAMAAAESVGDFFTSISGGGSNQYQERVNNHTALQIATVFACVKVVSEDVSTLPLHVYKRTQRGKERQSGNLSDILNKRPSKYYSAMDFRRTLTAHALLFGNGYAEIVRDNFDQVVELIILDYNKVKLVDVGNGELKYEVKINRTDKKYLDIMDVIHIKNMSLDGCNGLSVVNVGNRSLTTALALEKFAGNYFNNNSFAGGVLSPKNKLDKDAYSKLVEVIEKQIRGTDKAHRLAFMPFEVEYQKYTTPNNDAQFLESRQFAVRDICKFFRVPPHKVSDLSSSNYATIESQNQEYLNTTLSSWLVQWENECYFKLLSSHDQEQEFYIEHLREALLKGDINTRYAAYAIGRQWGWLSINDIRSRENMDTIEGGDNYLEPLNMGVVGKDYNTALVKDLSARLAKAELNELDRQVNRADFDADKFSAWADNFYDKHNKYVLATLSPYLAGVNPHDFTLEKHLLNLDEKGKRDFVNHVKYIYTSQMEQTINERL